MPVWKRSETSRLTEGKDFCRLVEKLFCHPARDGQALEVERPVEVQVDDARRRRPRSGWRCCSCRPARRTSDSAGKSWNEKPRPSPVNTSRPFSVVRMSPRPRTNGFTISLLSPTTTWTPGTRCKRRGDGRIGELADVLRDDRIDDLVGIALDVLRRAQAAADTGHHDVRPRRRRRGGPVGAAWAVLVSSVGACPASVAVVARARSASSFRSYRSVCARGAARHAQCRQRGRPLQKILARSSCSLP